jgi:hypothetical protein
MRLRVPAAVIVGGLLTLGVAGCGDPATPAAANAGAASPSTAVSPSQPGMGSMDGPSGSGGHDMPGMPMPDGTGLSPTVNGYTLTVAQPPVAGVTMPVTLRITRAGKPVTRFTPEQTKLMHLYLIRSDLTGFQHLHPAMADDGTWTSPPVAATPGAYRLYTQFIPQGVNDPLVLSTPVIIPGPGSGKRTPIPPAATSTAVDGYTLTVAGTPMAGLAAPLTVTIRRGGTPVTDLQPYLSSYAHVTAFHAGDLVFAHLHPEGPVHGNTGGPTLTLHAELSEPGTYRLFIQFQTRGVLHTAPITLTTT